MAGQSVTASGNDVVINFTAVYAPAAASFIDSNANWVPSPTAIKNLGERKFLVMPVGAGPLHGRQRQAQLPDRAQAQPDVLQAGPPLLDQLTFKSIGGDEAAYQALQAGQAQANENLSTPTLIDQMKKDPKLQVTQQLSTSPYNIQLNTNAPPFNNPKARQAIYYATDSEAIRSKLFQNRYPSTQGFTGPGGLFFSADVPGYRTYDLAKAKALVKELGGLKTQLGTINVLVAKQTTQALASQWAQAGIKTEIKSYDLGPLIEAFQSKKWTAMLQTAGSYDPAAGVGVAFRYASQSPFSGVKDKQLDALLGQALGTLDQDQRKSLYDQAAKYMNDEAYSPFLFAFAPASVAAKGVTGPGLTTALTCVVVTPSILY